MYIYIYFSMVAPRLFSLLIGESTVRSLSIIRSFPGKIAACKQKKFHRFPIHPWNKGRETPRGWRMLLARPLYDDHLVVK